MDGDGSEETFRFDWVSCCRRERSWRSFPSVTPCRQAQMQQAPSRPTPPPLSSLPVPIPVPRCH